MPVQAQQVQDANVRVFNFGMAAQPMTEALLAYSRTTGLQVASSPAALAGVQSAPIRGRMTADEALRRMTEGTPVKARIVGSTVMVERQSAQAADSATIIYEDAQPEIVVAGYRESLARAEQIKKAATGSVDVILAQDIAAFPDQNLAEALQRIPGVTISRDSGEGRQISLRGLGPDFTRTQLNGMEVLTNTSTGLDSRGTFSRTRAFDYSIFASELFNQVTVEKSYTAQQDEGGIGGTVGLRTAKPFDYDGSTVVVSAKGQFNQHTKKLTPRVVGLISGQAGDFGGLLSVAYSKADTVEFGYRNWNWSQINFRAPNVGPAIPADVRNLLVNARGADRVWNSRAQTYATWFNQRERLGVTGALQYHPDDKTDVTLDVLYGRLTNNRETYALGAAGTNNVSANDITGTQVLTGVTINKFNSITAASFTGVDMRTEARDTLDTTDFWQVALGAKHSLTDTVHADLHAGWSRSTFQSGYQQAQIEAVGKGYSFSGLDTETPRNAYDFDITDGSAWDLFQAESRDDRMVSEFFNVKGELAWDVSDSSTLKAGGGYKVFENSASQRRRVNNYDGRPGLPDVPTTVLSRPSVTPYAVADVAATMQLLGLTAPLTAANTTVGSDFELKEKSIAAFAQYNLDTSMGDVGVRANIGVRYYRTTLESLGTALVGTTLTPVSITNRYDGFLPAANLALDVTPSIVVRVSANRNLNRPALSDMRAAATINVANFGGTISAGNPNLTPFIADSVEGSFEYYDGKRGSFAVGLFYKKMKSFITTETTPVPYNTTGFPVSLLLPGQDPAILYNYTRPVNGEGASIKGVEIAAKRDFDFLPAPFDRLGMVANVTFADGTTDVVYSGTSVTLPLLDLSKVSSNATLYYDTPVWGGRASAAMRSKYRRGSGGNGNIGEYFTPTTNIDASAYVNVNENLRLTLEAVNITDQNIIQYADKDAKRLMTDTISGRTILFGATMRF
ncbi:TonB-dependent receptor [Novosphingobium sp. 17-62-19]|uniref:TonB-dependent receptor n=1 Tax=Novosphingobium sp. 17-62-19 TaxID=1970406 RepID=UPI0025FFCA88|nr:TonB-dependent receptor [Novosphingobium sp. 17-62-19]HQS96365.1 TonB-dependent receptor [Novosphingobium sp.]